MSAQNKCENFRSRIGVQLVPRRHIEMMNSIEMLQMKYLPILKLSSDITVSKVSGRAIFLKEIIELVERA